MSEAKVSDPWKALAAAIIKKAVEDWKKYKLNYEKREELTSFFNSGWFDELAWLCGIDAAYTRERFRIPERVE